MEKKLTQDERLDLLVEEFKADSDEWSIIVRYTKQHECFTS